MLSLSRTTRVFLATEPTDMKKGFDGLFALVENVIREDPSWEFAPTGVNAN